MRVLMVASEANPYIKSGGLADVLGSLPKALTKKQVECMVVLPKYKDMKNVDTLTYLTNFKVWVGWRNVYCGVFSSIVDGVTYYFIDNEQYFNRDGLYGYGDDYERFAFFDLAVMEMISHLQLHVDVLHLHDWQASMVAMLYKEKYYQYRYYENIRIIFTIHNIAYQGKADPNILSDMYGMSKDIYENGNCRHDNCLNMMKCALIYSDYITTVSPTYAKEILTPGCGEGLESVLQMRAESIHGIINGIDENEINPETDSNIYKNYTLENVFENKVYNKLELQKECGLPQNKRIPCIGIVTRFTWQKGMDLLLQRITTLMEEDIQIVVLGAGDTYYEQAFSSIASQYPKQVSYQQKYDFSLAQRIYAGCDMFLMPSLFEPCGLSQMMALRFGTIPIVRETGGLRDSVKAYNKYTGEGNGFRFYHYHADDMMQTINHAITLYKDHQQIWKRLIRNAMETKLGWELSAQKYIDIYQ